MCFLVTRRWLHPRPPCYKTDSREQDEWRMESKIKKYPPFKLSSSSWNSLWSMLSSITMTEVWC